MTFTASLMLALAMLIAPDMRAQSRRSGGGSTTTQQQSGSSSSSNRRSGGSSSSSSSTRSSSTTSSTSSSSSTRSSGTVQQQQQSSNRRSSGTATTGSSSATRSGSNSTSGTVQQQNNNRRSSGSTSNSSATRSSSSSSSSSSSRGTVRSSSATTRSSSEGTRVVSGETKPQPQQQSQRSSGTVRSSNVTSSGLTGTAVENPEHRTQEVYRDNGYNYRYNDGIRVDDRHNMYRVAPRQRDPLAWDRPGHFYGDAPHYYGYRIHSIPPSWRRISHWGIDYYYHNGIYYRPYGGSYVICRPPFGTPLERAIDRAILRAIRFAYYYDTYRTYDSVFDYYNVIARQNLIIAQQNARIIARNSNYAINSNKALSAYELANRMGLVQSYAYANSEYFYQDGVFYTVSPSGVYTTIVPPAGALVTSLPDDYEVIVMNGIEYYLVDNTVFRTTVFEGEPYLEVLGQMYGTLYSQYNIYR